MSALWGEKTAQPPNPKSQPSATLQEQTIPEILQLTVKNIPVVQSPKMLSENVGASPIDSVTVPVHKENKLGKVIYRYENKDRGYADLFLTNCMHLAARGVTGGIDIFGSPGAKDGWLYVRSLLWRILNSSSGANLVLVSEENLRALTDAMRTSESSTELLPKSFEDIVLEASRVTFEDRCIETLINLQSISGEISIPYQHRLEDSVHFWKGKTATENGQAFACDEELACQVYSHLFETRLLDLRKDFDESRGRHERNSLTPKALMLLEKYRLGNSGKKTGFLVRKYDPSRDAFFDRVFSEVKRLSGIHIEPVWAKEHIEKVDERIFRLIREASVVVVDVSIDRYNVGLEHGFAMGLGKPIVLMKRKNKAKNVLPFDFATQNCAFYSDSLEEEPEFVKKLSERIKVAVEYSKLKPYGISSE